MNLVRRVVEILVERFIASAGSLFAARLETIVGLMHAEQQDALEERARQYEDDGKMQLAAELRSRAAQIATATPGASGHDVVRQLQYEHAEIEMSRIGPATDEPREAAAEKQSAESTPPRTARRRSCPRPKTD